MAPIVLVIVVMLLSSPVLAQRTAPTIGVDPTADVIDHSRFDSLWRASKRFGRMKTSGVLSECYRTYRQTLATARPDGFLPESQLAFWVNAYLACLMETMHWRTGYRSTMWDSLYLERDTFHVAGVHHTLASLGERAVEVAGTVRARAFLATGSTNEPPFPTHACYAKTVRREMRAQLRKVVRSERYVLFDPAGRVLQLARLFGPWVEGMIDEGGSIVSFLLPWVSESQAAQLALAGQEVRVVLSDRIERWRHRR